MIEEKTRDEIKKTIEAILYLSSDLEIKELLKFFNLKKEELDKILIELQLDKKDSGLNLKIDKTTVYFETNPRYGELVHNFFNQESKPKKLSKAAMETLSIIAYKQPITKGQIEEIRGVGVERVVHNLEEKGLVCISGRLDTIGKPNLYSTTTNFLNYLNIKVIEELPNYEEVKGRNNGKNEIE